METIDCKEIYYASTEHSIITGYAGFGVRTYTEGMQVDEVTEIVEKCAPGYSVETDRMLTFEQISQNPLPTSLSNSVRLRQAPLRSFGVCFASGWRSIPRISLV